MCIVIDLIQDAWVPLMSLAWFLVGLLMGMRLRGGRRSGYAGNAGSSSSTGGGRVHSPEIYVGNLADNAAEGDVRKAFEKFGAVKDVRVVTSRADGTAKVFAFITMGGVAEAQAAVDGMNGRDLGGRKVVVSEARSRRRRGRR
jgi:RNA recognition motif-containing protein